MSFLEETIEKLNKIPELAQNTLRMIRDLDKQVQTIKASNNQKKGRFFALLEVWKDRKNAREKDQLDQMYLSIIQSNQKIEALCRSKIKLAQDLYDIVHQPTQKIDKQVNAQRRQRNSQFTEFGKKKKGKRGKHGLMKEKWDYGTSEPSYCYCGRPSYGEMVECQNPECEKQWFHIQCIDGRFNRNLPFYCKECSNTNDMIPKIKKLSSKNKKK